ncbi:MAG: anti-sigma factor family protein [Pyrinomonadaceae bacterium]
MTLPIVTTEKECARERIVAYLDCELAPREELALEAHLAQCECCLSELNLQKRLLLVLDAAFDEKAEIKLPKNFAKTVATRAETNVKGLRSKDERDRAFFFCASLFLIILAGGVGAQTETALASISQFGEQILGVLRFTGHLAYNLFVGLTVILRSVGNQPVFNSTIVFIFLFAAFILSAILFSRFIYNSNRS